VERKKPGRKSKSRLNKESGRWRPTKRQVLWAIGMVVTLGTIALLVVQLYPGLWEDVSRGRVATLIGIGVALTALIVLLAMGSASLGWTGFRGKTLWDVLQLLIVPLVLVGIGLLFEMQQAERENQRAEAERELADQRAQDEALQAYLDQMSNLLLVRKLRDSEEGSEVRTLARARTATVMQRLDAEGNRNVARFLNEAGLMGTGESSLSLLTKARLSGVDLSGIGLEYANFYGANLYGANLSEANLSRANLSSTILAEADLSAAFLTGANLMDAELQHVDLRRAVLSNANLINTDLRGSNLSEADLYDADVSFFSVLSGVNLSGADLRSANLEGADLSDALLVDADLSGADLSRASLRGAKGFTNEELEKQAWVLKGATMPNGQKYEDWLKSRGEDGENTGP